RRPRGLRPHGGRAARDPGRRERLNGGTPRHDRGGELLRAYLGPAAQGRARGARRGGGQPRARAGPRRVRDPGRNPLRGRGRAAGPCRCALRRLPRARLRHPRRDHALRLRLRRERARPAGLGDRAQSRDRLRHTHGRERGAGAGAGRDRAQEQGRRGGARLPGDDRAEAALRARPRMSESSGSSTGTAMAARGGKRSVARLAAVQALYQMEVTGAPAATVIAEFTTHRLGKEIDGDRYAEADRRFFTELVGGLAERREEIDRMLSASLPPEWPLERLERVLRAILRLGAFELFGRSDVPARVAINEYLEIAHAFFAEKEPGLVNGVLDRIAHLLRPREFAAGGSDGVP